MIVLDTNVIFEPLRTFPDANAVDWLDRQDPRTLFLTATTLAELFAGVELMPIGRRRNMLEAAIRGRILPQFAGRILSFDESAADNFAVLYSRAQKGGMPIGFADCTIAAIAGLRGFAVATRDTKDFVGTGVDLINPWDLESS